MALGFESTSSRRHHATCRVIGWPRDRTGTLRLLRPRECGLRELHHLPRSPSGSRLPTPRPETSQEVLTSPAWWHLNLARGSQATNVVSPEPHTRSHCHRRGRSRTSHEVLTPPARSHQNLSGGPHVTAVVAREPPRTFPRHQRGLRNLSGRQRERETERCDRVHRPNVRFPRGPQSWPPSALR